MKSNTGAQLLWAIAIFIFLYVMTSLDRSGAISVPQPEPAKYVPVATCKP